MWLAFLPNERVADKNFLFENDSELELVMSVGMWGRWQDPSSPDVVGLGSGRWL